MTLAESIGRMCGERGLIDEYVGLPNQRSELCDEVFGQVQRDAPALAGRSDSANRRMRVAPSRSCSIDVAYEMRM